MPALTLTAAWLKPVVPMGGGTATLLVRIAPDSAPTDRRAPIDVAFVLDRSGSMAGSGLALAREGVSVAVGHLRDEDRAALVAYDHGVDVVHPLAPATGRAKATLRLALHGLDPGGSTDLGGGWLAGCGELANAAPAEPAPSEDRPHGRLRRTILLTDGLANVGITDPTALTDHAHQLRRRGIATTTVGVGASYDGELLTAMAEAGGGNYHHVLQASELPALFAVELRELLTVAASGLTVALHLPAGVAADLVGPYPTERDGARLAVPIGDLTAGDVLDLVFAVRYPAGSVGTTVALRAEATWTDLSADARTTRPIPVPPLALADPATVDALAADPTVAEAAALQQAAQERRTALRLDRAGDYAASRASWRRASAILAEAPATEAVQADRAEAASFVAYSPLHAIPETDRLAALHRAHRRGRGKSDTGPKPDSV